MISDTQVVATLTDLENLYNTSSGVTNPSYYAKLAIIEAAGWVEECLDSIVLNISNTRLIVPGNQNSYSQNTVRSNSGFNYEKYIRNKLLMGLIGLVLIEKLELSLASSADFVCMKPALQNLTNARNDNAHTHISGTTSSIIAPSLTRQYFTDIHAGLIVLEGALNNIQFL